MHRALAMALGFLLICVSQVLTAPASAETLTIRYVKAVTPGTTSQLEVSAASDIGIDKVQGHLKIGNSDPFARVDDFQLTNGDSKDGIWRTAQAVQLKSALIDIYLSVTLKDGNYYPWEYGGQIDLRAATRFTSIAVTPGYGEVKVSGRLVQADDPGQQGVGEAVVHLQHSPDRATWKTVDLSGEGDEGDPEGVTTDAAGDFTMTNIFGDPYHPPLYGYWRAAFLKDPNLTFLPSESESAYADGRLKTRIIHFNASPEPVRKGSDLEVRGKFQVFKGEWVGTRRDSAIFIQFRPRGSSQWIHMGYAICDSDGVFQRIFAAEQDGTWRAIHRQNGRSLPATSTGDYVDVQ